MMTVRQISRLAGVSVRTLHHYDAVGLLKPSAVTQAGYRLYDSQALERLRRILLFRALGFSLREIGLLLEDPGGQGAALERQLALLRGEKARLEGLILLAQGLKTIGVDQMDLAMFDQKRAGEYAAQAQAAYGHTAEYREYAQRAAGRSQEEFQGLSAQLMAIFAEFGQLRPLAPEAPPVQAKVEELRAFITRHFYTCSRQVLRGLGTVYAADPRFSANIDRAGGPGTADFVSRAISACPVPAPQAGD